MQDFTSECSYYQQYTPCFSHLVVACKSSKYSIITISNRIQGRR